MSGEISGPSSSLEGRSSSSSSGYFPLPCPSVVGMPSKGTLQGSRSRFFSSPDISTAITPKWLATSTKTVIRLYNIPDWGPSEGIRGKLSLPDPLENERIQDIAMSDVLLAVATNRRLLLYEFGSINPRKTVRLEEIDRREIHMNRSWIPQTVAVLYQGTGRQQRGDSAWVAVGGPGNIGIKLYSYLYDNGWEIENELCELECPNNLGSVRLVTFSPSQLNSRNDFLVLGVTTSNQVHCWRINPQNIATSASQPIQSCWILHGSSRQDEPPKRGNITSARIFLSLMGLPHVFCTVYQTHGSQLLHTFIVPIQIPPSGRKEVAASEIQSHEKTVGRYVLSGAVTTNGRFIVTIENDGTIKLLTVHSAYDREGLMTSLPKLYQPWPSALVSTTPNLPTISMAFEEDDGGFKVIAVDGEGHFFSVRVNVPNAPERRISILPPRLPPHEVDGERPVFELSQI